MEEIQAAFDRSESLKRLIEKAYYEPIVSPHWAIDGNGFSYRRRTGPDFSARVFIDCITAEECACHDDDGGNLVPLNPEHWTQNDGDETTITFVNKRQGEVLLFWIDWDGNAQEYPAIEGHSRTTRHTYVGHVWRIVDPITKKRIVSFEATDSGVGVIEEHIEGEENEDSDSHASDDNSIKDSCQVYIRNYNVWIHTETGEDVQISSNGSDNNPYDERTYVSPDHHYAVVWQYTPEDQHLVHTVESSPSCQVEPRLHSWQYLKPGDKVRVDRPRMFDLRARAEVSTDDALFRNPFCIDDIGWDADGGEYRFLFNQRGHQTLRVIGMGIDGTTRTLVEESSKTFIDYSSKTYHKVINNGKEMIWASERDGWNHLYLIDLMEAKIKTQITRGAWVVQEVEKVDEGNRQIWFKALGLVKEQDPYYMHLARINFDGTGLKVLTSGNGTHHWQWSPDGRFLIDKWSRVDQPHQIELRSSETGSRIRELQSGSMGRLIAAGWSVPERFNAPGRDGKTEIYGIIVSPSNLDKSRKYPVIEKIYAGPHDFHVPKAFGNLLRQHELAELGFVVVQIDGMGTNWRSKAFHDVCHKNLGDAGFPDRIAWMQAAAKDRPWTDLDRIGIYGGSAGGQSALGALLFHGEFYKAAVADSGCHDNRMDKLWWNEAWMGWPVDESYSKSSNVVHATNLTGKLMLMVGELDNNVDPNSTMQVVNALVKAQKDFDLVILPGEGHGAGLGSAYGRRRMKDFFVRHLLGIEPPERNRSRTET